MYSNPDFLVIFAAGNCGDTPTSGCLRTGTSSIATPATAKNVLAVGATRNSANAQYLASLTSRGPTSDGRIKPDVLSPGFGVFSARASAVTDGNHTESCATISKTGTSMATPGVAGAALLIIDYFKFGYHPSTTPLSADSKTPSAAMLKAILVNSGQAVTARMSGTGQMDIVPYPGNEQGHGRVQLDQVLPFDGDFKLLAEERVCTADEVFTFTLEMRSTHVDLSATLTWVDPPGVPNTANILVNDLDLAIALQNGTSSYYPNGLDQADPTNTVERIIITSSSFQKGDTYDVIVNCTRVVDPPQVFALAVTGYFDWTNDTYDYAAAGMFQPTAAPTLAPTIAPVPTPAPTPAPQPGSADDDEVKSLCEFS